MKKNYTTTYIIDDDPIFVMLFTKILQKLNNFGTIIHFENAQLALNSLIEIFNSETSFPDVIFLDINMPVLDGLQFLKKLEKENFNENLNIYMVSSSIDSKEIATFKKYKNVKNFVSKPINKENFLDKLI